MLIGYARVSTQDQNLELQTEALTKAGCKKIFSDRLSGSRAERPGLTHAQEALREGDTLVVWKLDRLGRSVKQLVSGIQLVLFCALRFTGKPLKSPKMDRVCGARLAGFGCTGAFRFGNCRDCPR
jgi:hypothetical protein